VQPVDNLEVAARLLDLLRDHVQVMGEEDVKQKLENLDCMRIQGLNGTIGARAEAWSHRRALQELSYATMLQHVNLVMSW